LLSMFLMDTRINAASSTISTFFMINLHDLFISLPALCLHQKTISISGSPDICENF